jgi:hypothetical protein
MGEEGEASDEHGLVSNRVLEIVVALALLGLSAIIITDSIRLGITWAEGEGPRAGYFPFYTAVVLGTASIAILLKAVMGKGEGLGDDFVSRPAFVRVMTVLLPAIIYVGAVQYIGLYAASALFIFFFMIFVGGESVLRAILVSVCVPVFFFVMFEKWFLVPLPKGPLEALLGY